MGTTPDSNPLVPTASAPAARSSRHWALWALLPLILLAAAWALAQRCLPGGELAATLHTTGEGQQSRGC